MQRNKNEQQISCGKVPMEKLKSDLRLAMRQAMGRKSEEMRETDSARLCAKLKEQPFFQNAGSILFFASLPEEEPDLWPLLNETLAGKQMVALPCFDADNQTYHPRRVTDIHVEILSGKFGIREPAPTCVALPLDDLDLVLVPGVAFDAQGHRLGRGKGFYDRMLENFKGKKIGVAFDEQIADEIPVEKNDVRMDFVLTPTRCLTCSS
jgi:5-formyltetrahydrofolate cyclo-ligase